MKLNFVQSGADDQRKVVGAVSQVVETDVTAAYAACCLYFLVFSRICCCALGFTCMMQATFSATFHRIHKKLLVLRSILK